mmetsp:Transcript_23611/g.80666  ORF Transcript_23611/g.80666 Transcript_23611/m.80666 type:complete len:202 (-) Transcript_23611:609-1214(-)
MTSPTAESDLLMDVASLSWSPTTPDFSTRSLPAKSTKVSLPFTTWPVRRFVVRRTSEMTRCDRDDSAFMAVAVVCRLARPDSRAATRASKESTRSTTAPPTATRPVPDVGASLTVRGAALAPPRGSGASRSTSASRYNSNKHKSSSVVHCAAFSSNFRKISTAARGMTPAEASTAHVFVSTDSRTLLAPPMVYVLPDPVCP